MRAMDFRRGILIAAFAAVLLTTLGALLPAAAQMPALLPSRDDVPETEALPIDGVWTISTLGKRIHIERGRAYAVDPWLHLFVMQIQKDMVVIRNMRRIGTGRFVGDDLPLVGPATFTLLPDGNMNVHVRGAMGPVSFALLKQTPDDPSALDAELAAISGDGDAPPSAAPPSDDTPPVEAPPSDTPPETAPPAADGNPLVNCKKLGIDPNTGDIVCND